MAEIPIERKTNRNWLPLLLGLLALLALGFWFLRRDRAPDTASTTTDSATVAAAPGAAPVTGSAAGETAAGAAATGAAAGAAAGGGGAGAAIDQFTQFVQTRDTTVETEARHQYTAEGTRRLAAALEALAAGGNANISVYADSMRGSIDRLQRSGPDDKHADDAKAAFSAAVSAMERIDRDRGRTRDVAPMRAIYNELSAQRPLVPQLGVVHRFFEAARDALTAMRA